MCPTADPPVHVAGVMTRFEGSSCIVEVSSAGALVPEGARAVVSVTSHGGMRILGAVTASEGDRLDMEIIRVVRKDKRDYPRMFGGIELRYRVVPEEEMALAERAWTAGLAGVSDDHPWHEPDPFMNFSGSGIRFRDRDACEAGDQLLIEMKVPTTERCSGVEAQRTTATGVFGSRPLSIKFLVIRGRFLIPM